MEKQTVLIQEDELELSKENRQLLLTLPRVKSWDEPYLFKYQGFWCPSKFFPGIFSFQNHFQARDDDTLLITFPKSGTTWLKALTYAIINRSRYPLENFPLLTATPHWLVPFLELDLYSKNQSPSLENIPSPRIFATHTPYASLPDSILNSNCRIIYLCRNPLDQFISHWYFYYKPEDQTFSLEEAFEMVCYGIHIYGPIWEHILGFWKASIQQPNKILFLKYEDLKEDNVHYIKRLAKFLGCPFSKDEETKGVIEKISKLFSCDNMKELDVNKTGQYLDGARNNSFFRKGKVGEWKNHLTPSMSERLEKLLNEKLEGNGLSFKKA